MPLPETQVGIMSMVNGMKLRRLPDGSASNEWFEGACPPTRQNGEYTDNPRWLGPCGSTGIMLGEMRSLVKTLIMNGTNRLSRKVFP